MLQKKASGCEEVSILGAAKLSNLCSEKTFRPPSAARWSGSAKPAPRGKESSVWKPSKRSENEYDLPGQWNNFRVGPEFRLANRGHERERVITSTWLAHKMKLD
jgi:hypothetical protein